MLVAGLTLGHHCVTWLHVTQDQRPLLNPVLLILVQLCVQQAGPKGPGQNIDLC